MTRTLFNGTVAVDYGQVYVMSKLEGPDVDEAFRGQVNGICGAASSGALVLITGLQTGHVPFTIEAHDAAPPVDDQWEEVVEASFTSASPDVVVAEWGGQTTYPFELPGQGWRVRYCARGMDAARDADNFLGGPSPDRYLVQFWPAPPRPDVVVKQTSGFARRRHEHVQQGSAVRADAPADEAADQGRPTGEATGGATAAEERPWWADLPPAERYLRTDGNALSLAELDRRIPEQIASAGSDAQRAIARWAARRACELAGLDRLGWVANALMALDQAQELPAPFGDAVALRIQLKSDPAVPDTRVERPKGGRADIHQQQFAVMSVGNAAWPDHLPAAISAVYMAAVTSGPGYRKLLQELRDAFPALT